MTTDPKPSTNRNAGTRRTLRIGAAILVVALLLGGVFLRLDLDKERPDFYQPARAPLSEAAVILSETYAEEKELVEKLQTVHTRLDYAIGLLGQAERLDPADKRQIETLEVRLRALEEPDRMLKIEPTALKRAYHALTEQLSALAEKLERSEQ